MASMKSILIIAAIIGVVALVAQAASDDLSISLFDKIFSKFTSKTCDKCIAHVTELRDKVLDPKYVDSIKKQAEQSCNLLPNRDECIKQIDDLVDEIVKVIKTKQPVEICQQLRLCPY